MSYLALYRRFRPKVFEDLIGQDVVVQALINQIKTDKVGHAYLFCGARGTGKTTVAKIFARAINCESASGSPCGKCPTCQKLDDPSNLDVVEMDAASNNKVENVREIRDKVQYPPVAGRYKVYIIDEVHMLTTEAFNALLKTLEEPPKHAVFILATTEPHKLPQTILSRCMRFDFKLVPNDLLIKHISDIFDKLGKEYEIEAVKAIARAGEGSVRDALSVADICVSYSERKLTYKDVCEVLGATDKRLVGSLVASIIDNDIANSLSVTDKLLNLGKSAMLLNRDVLSYLRDLLVVYTCKNSAQILSLPPDEIDELKAVTERTDSHRLLRCVEIFSAVENDLKYSTHPRIVFETALVKATQNQSDYNIDALMSRIKKLEQKIEELSSAKFSVVAQSSAIVQPQPQVQSQPQVRQSQKEQQVPDDLVKAVENRIKPEIKTEIKTERQFKSEEITQPEPEPTNEQKIERTVRQPEQTMIQESVEIKPTINERRIWGSILRRLRESNKMLWAACQELETTIQNKKLIIKAQDSIELKMLQRQENILFLNNVLQEFAPYEIEISSFDGTVVKSEQSEDLSKIKENFAPINIEE